MLHLRALLDIGRRLLLIVWILLLFPVLIVGQAPDSLSFQGYLTDTGGAPLSTTVPMTFKLYKSGVKVWEQTHASVAVINGRFDVLLGGTGTASLDTVAFNEPIDLGITVGGDAEIVPKTPLASAAYALGIRGMYARAGRRATLVAPNLIGGAWNNHVKSIAVGATISGGGGWSSGTPRENSVIGDWGTVGGGAGNHVEGSYSTIAGGLGHAATGLYTTIGGGRENSATESGATVAGGQENDAKSLNATVGGGESNVARALSATVGGGKLNVAAGLYSTVSGGLSNEAFGVYSAIPGGEENRATGYASVALGYKARANHSGTFVWNDRSVTTDNDSLVSTAQNQFLIRAAGGVGIGTTTPGNQLSIVGDADITGNLGIGTDSPAAQIHTINSNNSGKGLKIESIEGDRASFYYSADQGLVIDTYRPSDTRRLDLLFQPNGGNVGIGTFTPGFLLEVDGDAAKPGGGSWTVASDERLKDVIAPFDRGLDALRALHPVSYRYKKDNPRGLPSDQTYVGLIAQVVEEMIPEAVDRDEAGYLHLNNDPIIWTMLNAINDLREENERQRVQIDRLLGLLGEPG